MSKSILAIAACFLYSALTSQNLLFVENKGQWNSQVKFKTVIGAGALFLQGNGYRVILNNPEELTSISNYLSAHKNDNSGPGNLVLHSHAYQVAFQGGAANPEIVTEGEVETYNNYFVGNDRAKWASHCRVFNVITYKNVYPGIDVRYYTQNDHLEYDFVVRPGADIRKIKLRVDGVNELNLRNGDLVIKTSVGEVSEKKPLSFLQTSDKRSAVDVKYSIAGNVVSFISAAYDKKQTLVIDPTLIFSSYVGSTADDWGYSSAYDGQGNFYSGSIVFDNGFPVSVGAFQHTFAGGDGSEGAVLAYDVGIFKFNATGTQRLYATYLGGSGDEQPQSMATDSKGNLVVTGRTTSSNFPVTTANFGPCGNFDIYVTKFDATGSSLIASRKFGGSGADGVNIAPKYASNPAEGIVSLRRNYNDDSRSDITLDDSDNVYLVGCSRSSNFPFTVNAFKKILGGQQDGIFIKASPMLDVFTSSYIGGSLDDAAFSVSVDRTKHNIYIAGSTTSADIAFNGTNDTRGILHANFQGGACDGFISLISSDAHTLIRTCYIGTTGNDMLYELQTGHDGYPYVMGTTTTAFPVINATWSQPNGKQFITKLDKDFTSVDYSTNFGKGGSIPDISPTAFTVDVCGNVYVAGWGGKANDRYYAAQTTTGLTTTPDAISNITDGNDFYIFALSKNAGSQLFGSFFGINNPDAYGEHSDGASSRFDSIGNLYLAVCANCGFVGTFPTTAGVWSPNNPAITGARCNYAAVKIKFNFSNCALPVNFLNFTASYADHTTTLTWQTANEVNTDHFVVQQSADAVNFNDLASVQAKRSMSTNNYSYDQRYPSGGIHYYRLKIVDEDGSFTYSKTISVVVSENGKDYINVLPNPAHDIASLLYSVSQLKREAIIFNGSGIVVQRQAIIPGSVQCRLDLRSLSSGWYCILLRTDGNNFVKTTFLKN